MWIVRLALRRPYTFVVLALLMLGGGWQVLRRTPTDIFPAVDVPAISVVWTYSGLPAQIMEQQLTLFSEQSLAGNVPDVARIESQTFDGVAVIRVFLQPGTDVSAAVAQVTAISQTIVRRMPPGTQPPIILRYSATSVPILQLSFTSDTVGEAEVFDFVNSRVRSMLSVVRGTRFPLPAGGKFRQVVVELDLEALRAQGLSPSDVSAAISAQNLTLPTGTAKIGEREYRVTLNNSFENLEAFNDIPLRRPDGKTLPLREVAHVHDGYAVQTNIARQDGKRSVVLSVMKTGDASTVEVAGRIKQMLPTVQAILPEGVKVELLADQSTFVTNALSGLLFEGLLAAGLTAAAILLFLGSLRSTLVVAVSIPLSVVAALLAMRALGQTLNVMTLGGLALAVGVLVDDATVEMENVHRHLGMGKSMVRAILDGAEEIALPAFVASSAISIVFAAVFFLDGAVRYLFLPMGMAVGFSVMASYLLSRTLVPTLIRYVVPAQHGHGPVERLSAAFMARFDRVRDGYARLLGRALGRPGWVVAAAVLLVGLAAFGARYVGRDFYPAVDSGQVRLHVTAPPGTRLEETERMFSAVEAAIRELVPETDRVSMLDQLGLPGGYSLAISDSANVGSSDGEILLTLSRTRKQATQAYVKLLRRELNARFPELSFYFQPADVVTQVLNFGLPAPIDIQVSGQQREATFAVAQALERELKGLRGVVDVRLHQVPRAPKLHVEVDRARASEVGLSVRDVANNLLLAVGSSGQVNPGFWADPKSGFSYPVSVQVSDVRVDSLEMLKGMGLQTPAGQQLLGDLAELRRGTTPGFVSRVNVQPTFSVRADVQDADLGTVEGPLEALLSKHREKLPKGATLTLRGQVDSMCEGFSGLGLGLLVAAVLVYALMVINFQSWVDPFVILFALPGAGVGIVAVLGVTQTTFNIPSLMGALMSVGVATSNAILVVTFANQQRARGLSAREAALEAGRVRLRPVVMTALAMALGMLPMALGRSEGGEQNAALGRAVLGGLGGATVATLFLVPVIYSLLRRRPPTPADAALGQALLERGEGVDA
ncbi:MAG: hypothetical protein RL653_4460 [Pseudomonadota bacterium]